MISKKNRFFGAVLLVSGTTIGAAMLALPMTTGLAGFIPALLLLTFVWLFMMLTAFYLLEVNLRMKGESNVISMMHKTLGRPGEIISWIAYLLLLYSLMAAYMVGSSQILKDFFDPFIPIDIPDWIWPVMVFLIFSVFIYFGTETADFCNRFLMIGLILSYLFLVYLGIPSIKLPLLNHYHWGYLLPSISIVVTSFGYHIIIPTLTTYLDHDSRLLKRAILLGSLIPFVVYLIWQMIVIGIVPVDGEVGLMSARDKGDQVIFYLQRIVGSSWLGAIARSVAFFAIVTSLLGVSLSLSDFLADGLKIKKSHGGKLSTVCLTFIPPLLFSLFYPQGFLIALQYAGIFVIILLALLPALMAWFERYGSETERSFIKSDFKVPGGKACLIGTMIISLILLGVEVFV